MSIIETIHLIRAGLLYFAIVFAVGFLLGMLRILLMVPLIGVRYAELLEMPFVLALSYVTARFLVGKMSVSPDALSRIVMGATGLVFMLIAEFGFVLWLQRISIRDYLADRDPVTTAAFYLSLLLFAIMPLFAGKRSRM